MGVSFYYAPETIPAPPFFDDHRICGDIKLSKVVDKLKSLKVADLYAVDSKTAPNDAPAKSNVVGSLTLGGGIALVAFVFGAAAMRWWLPKAHTNRKLQLETD